MDYTTSDGFETHVATGNRMHQDTAAVPTVLSAKDINALTWSLMEIVKAAGLTPQQFDPANVNTYRVLLAALKKVLIDRAGDADLTGDFRTSGTWTGAFALKLANAYINALGSQVIFNMDVDDYLQYRRDIDAFDFRIGGITRMYLDQFGPGRNDDASTPNGLVRRSQVESLVDAIIPIGFPAMWPASSPPSGWIKRNGMLVSRTMFPRLTDAVVSGQVNVVSEADWPDFPGAFTLGDGSTTIRVPDGRGLVDKGHHDGSGAFTTNTARALSSYEADVERRHRHKMFADGAIYGLDANGAVSRQVNVGSGTLPSNNSNFEYSLQSATGEPWIGITSEVGGPENLIRNASYLPILRAA